MRLVIIDDEIYTMPDASDGDWIKFANPKSAIEDWRASRDAMMEAIQRDKENGVTINENDQD